MTPGSTPASARRPTVSPPAFHDRLAGWVASGGTLLVAAQPSTGDHPPAQDDGHGCDHASRHASEHGHEPVAAASVTAAVASRLERGGRGVVTADERRRTVGRDGGRQVPLHDVVVRAVGPS